MRPTTVSVTGATTSQVVVPDAYLTPFNLSLSTLVTGTSNYTVQYTFDNVFALNYSPATGNWFNHPTLASQTANAQSNIAYPVSGVRVIGNSGTGSVLLTIIQAGVQ